MGFKATELEWSDISRGMQREPEGKDELQIRSFWRRWHSLVADLPYKDNLENGLPWEGYASDGALLGVGDD